MEYMQMGRCNCCGKEYQVTEKELCHIKKQWGYFSNKDGTIQEFDVCEDCFDRWLAQFAIPPEKKKATELI